MTETQKELSDEMIETKAVNYFKGTIADSYPFQQGFIFGAKWARDFLSTHTREVAEKAFEAGREMEIRNNDGNTWYQKFPTFEDYLNSLNPEGK